MPHTAVRRFRPQPSGPAVPALHRLALCAAPQQSLETIVYSDMRGSQVIVDLTRSAARGLYLPPAMTVHLDTRL